MSSGAGGQSRHATRGRPDLDEAPTHPVGEAAFHRLQCIHHALRQDLATVNRLAARVLDGLPGHEVRAGVVLLRTSTPLWDLRRNCLGYCRFVEGHHDVEDTALFPALRASNPAIGPAVDRLEADHREVAEIAGEVEQAADDLVREDTPAARSRLAGALRRMSDHLLGHLEFEEETIGPTMRRWSREP